MKRSIFISMTCIAAISIWAATTDPVGYVSQKGQTHTVKGEVVTLRYGQLTPETRGTEVILKYHDALFTGRVGVNIAGTTITAQWVPAPDAKVDQVLVGNEELTLLLDGFLEGRIITKEYGSIPVFFYFPGLKDSSTNPSLCILVFDEEQLNRIPKDEE